MEIEWPLVLFTLLTGMGGCMFLFVCVNEFKRLSDKDPFIPGLVAGLITVVGGFASVLHLSHADRIMNALSRPTSGIFVEAVLIGIMCVFAAAFLILLKRGLRESVATKACAVLGAAFGVALSFMAGHSYVMIAYDAWNTLLLPLGYLGTSLSMGATLYWTVACSDSQSNGRIASILVVVCGAISSVTILAYMLVPGVFDRAPAYCLLSLACAVIVIVMGILNRRYPGKYNAVIALIAAMASGLLYRMAMWVVGVGVYSFFS